MRLCRHFYWFPALFMLNCATSYKPIHLDEDYPDGVVNDHLRIACKSGDFGKNDRINSKARHARIMIEKCKVVNRSADSIEIAAIHDTAAYPNDTVIVLEEQRAFDYLAFGEAIYWLYAEPFGFALAYNERDGFSTDFGLKDPISLVLGVLIGWYNWSVAREANQEFKKEMEAYSLNGRIAPRDSTFAILYIKTGTRDSCGFGFTYRMKGNGSKTDTIRVSQKIDLPAGK